MGQQSVARFLSRYLPLVIWLVRESLVQRQRRWEDVERITQLVRANAIREAQTIEAKPEGEIT